MKTVHSTCYLFFLCLLPYISSGQCPINTKDFIVFTTQQEIDSFSIAYPNCTNVLGLRISGQNTSDIRNLNKLNQINHIGEGGLLIEFNDSLSNLEGLDNLQSIQGDCIIQNNNKLIDLNGFDNLRSITGNLFIKNNPNFISLEALSQLSILDGFELRNTSVENLNGLEQITNIEQDFVIRNNPLLVNLSALNNLQTISGFLWLWENPLITHLNDFSSLNTLNGISLRLNSQLNTCVIPALCNLFDQSAEQLVIRENDCGCSSFREVQAACDGFIGLPTCRAKDISLALKADFSVTINPESINDGSTDDCSFELSIDRSTFSCDDVGIQSINLTITDNEGNATSCLSNVTITEGTIPCEDAALLLNLPTLAFPCEEAVSINIPLSVKKFDNITSLQFSLNWDITLLRLLTINQLGISSISLEEDFVHFENGLTFAWFNPNFIPLSLNDSTVLFNLEMEVIDQASTTIQFVNSPIIIEAVDESLTAIEVQTNEGNILDTVVTTLVCNDKISVLLDTFGTVQLTPIMMLDSEASEDCGISTLSLDTHELNCANIGENLITVTAIDLADNESQCQTLVIVTDPIPPSIICPNNQLLTISCETQAYAIIFSDAVASDNCGINSINYSHSSGRFFPIGTTAVSVTAFSNSAEETNCTFEVVVEREACFNVSFYINDVNITCGEQVCLEVGVNNFTNVLNFNHTITWDTSLVTFANTPTTQFPSLSSSNFGINTNSLQVAWFDNTVEGITVVDSTTLYQICFDVKGSTNNTIPIQFSGDPEVSDGQGRFVNALTQDGQILIADVIPILSCPSDITVNCCNPILELPVPKLLDTCNISTTYNYNRSDILPLDAPFPIGITCLTSIANNEAGWVDSCSYCVTVLNNLPANTNDSDSVKITNNTCCPSLKNHITNGDFESGNINFTSDYIYQSDTSQDAIVPGTYSVLTTVEAINVCTQWLVDDLSTNCDGDGNFLIINGETGQANNTPNTVWEQVINGLDTTLTYELCANFKNLQQCCFDVLPSLYILVDAIPIDTIILDVTSFDPCQWQNINIPIDVINNTVTISFQLEETMLGDGNDFAIDNIAFYELAQQELAFSIQDQRPSGDPSITASINLIHSLEDTLASPTCSYQWTIAKIDSIDLANQLIHLDDSTIAMGTDTDGWDLSTDFVGYTHTPVIGTAPAAFQTGFYFIKLEVFDCDCMEKDKEVKVVGWRWGAKQEIPININSFTIQ